MLKKNVFLLAIGYTITLATVSLITLHNLPDVGVSNGDKIFHFCAYCVLGFLWSYSLLYTFKLKHKKAILLAAVFSIIFGIVIEVLQESLTETRALDVYDVLANTLGVILASLVLWFKKKLHVKNV